MTTWMSDRRHGLGRKTLKGVGRLLMCRHIQQRASLYLILPLNPPSLHLVRPADYLAQDAILSAHQKPDLDFCNHASTNRPGYILLGVLACSSLESVKTVTHLHRSPIPCRFLTIAGCYWLRAVVCTTS